MCCLLLPPAARPQSEVTAAGLHVQEHPFHLAMAAIEPEFHTYLQLTERLQSD